MASLESLATPSGRHSLGRWWWPALLLAAWTWDGRAAEQVIISEFMAANVRTLASAPERFDDWLELRNLESNTVTLAGWSLTDSPKSPRVWNFPDLSLPGGGHLLVWASGHERRQVGQPLHTNFKLGSGGEYLALIRPDGSVASAFTPKYPPQVPDVSYGFLPGSTQAVYFLAPTPGRPNESTTNWPGPNLSQLSFSPPTPTAADSLTVTVRAAPYQNAVTNVTLWWRSMFHRETNQPMATAGDGIWRGTIPAGQGRPGEIVRWRVTALDAAGHASALPVLANARVTSRYGGVMLQAEPVPSKLPVFHLFLAPPQLRNAESDGGARGCVVHEGEFYDNVLIKVRGNTTAGFPKKSHRLEFPHDHPLRHPGPGGRVRHTSFMAEYGDPTYLRQELSFWLQRETGSIAPFHYPVRLQLNGAFWQLAMHSEVLDEGLLSRHGLDPEGALYKAVGLLTPDFSSTGGFEKKTRRFEDESDYVALARALQESRGINQRRAHLFELFHVPSAINYLAAARLSQEDDDVWANLSLYHDNDGSGEWRPIAFDMNVSWGLSFAHGGIQATADQVRSHPFFGASGIGNNQGFNRLFDTLIRLPETRAMLLRRMRTILDDWWQPPGTPLEQRRIEHHISTLTNQFWAEAILDREKWGEGWNRARAAPGEPLLAAGVRELIERFIEPRRRHFYVTHAATNSSRAIGLTDRQIVGLPETQTADATLTLGPLAPCPSAPLQSYLVLSNALSTAVDISGWRLEGAAQFIFPAGTVVVPNLPLYVCRERKAFRARATGPRDGQGLFVLGDFRGALAPGEPLLLKNRDGKVVATKQ